MKRTVNFNANASEDDVEFDSNELQPDQFYKDYSKGKFQPRSRRNDFRNDNSENVSVPGSGASHQQYSDSYTHVQAHYNTVTSSAGTLKDRANSTILRLRNLNNWVKSVLINLSIHTVQDHIIQLAREIGIDTETIAVLKAKKMNEQQREMSLLFIMRQDEKGIWHAEINPDYPLPTSTKIALFGEDSSSQIALQQPLNPSITNPELYDNREFRQRQNLVLLDLCGGKGGDLFKFMENDIGGYLLADIADKSVEAAIERYNGCLHQPKRGRKLFPAKFIAANLCHHRLHYFLHPDISFDIISTQFAFHYGFQSESTLRRMLQNIADRLRPGGIFCATVPDARVLSSQLRINNNLSFGNSIYRVEFQPTPQLLAWLLRHNPPPMPPAAFDQDELDEWVKQHGHQQPPSDSTTPDALGQHQTQPDAMPFHGISPFGIQYRFTLEEAVHGVPEYLVIYPVLCQIAAEYGLKPILYENMFSFINNQLHLKLGNRDNFHLLNAISVFDLKKKNNKRFNHDSSSTSVPFPLDQWQGVGVYCAMAFQKVGEIRFQNHTIYHDEITNNVMLSDHIIPPVDLDAVFSSSSHQEKTDSSSFPRWLNSTSRYMYPDPLTAGESCPNMPSWEPLHQVKPSEMVNAFDGDVYDQSFHPPLPDPGAD